VVHRLEADGSVGHRVPTKTGDGVQEPVSKTICPGVEGAGHLLPLPVVGKLGVLPDRLLGEAWFQYLYSSESLLHCTHYIMFGYAIVERLRPRSTGTGSLRTGFCRKGRVMSGRGLASWLQKAERRFEKAVPPQLSSLGLISPRLGSSPNG